RAGVDEIVGPEASVHVRVVASGSSEELFEHLHEQDRIGCRRVGVSGTRGGREREQGDERNEHELHDRIPPRNGTNGVRQGSTCPPAAAGTCACVAQLSSGAKPRARSRSSTASLAKASGGAFHRLIDGSRVDPASTSRSTIAAYSSSASRQFVEPCAAHA